MKAKKPRNTAAQDATLINVRALKARMDDVEARLVALEALATAGDPLAARPGLEDQHAALEERIRARRRTA
jgi:hypothetical protein